MVDWLTLLVLLSQLFGLNFVRASWRQDLQIVFSQTEEVLFYW
jgi:hypothetical protein